MISYETKFNEMITQSPKPFLLYLKSDSGYIKLMYRDDWDDGLNHISRVRVINTRLGVTNAPASWEHMVKILEAIGVDETELKDTIDRRIDAIILEERQSMKRMRVLMGDDHVDKVLANNTQDSFAEGLVSSLKKVLGKRWEEKKKPSLNVIKGGQDI